MLLLFSYLISTKCIIVKEDPVFEECKGDFAVVNEWAVQLENGTCAIREEDGECTYVAYYNEDGQKIKMDVPEEVMDSFSNVLKTWYFDIVKINDDYVMYAGQGPILYVYSKTGVPPKYFIDEDTEKCMKYEIGPDWYRLAREGFY